MIFPAGPGADSLSTPVYAMATWTPLLHVPQAHPSLSHHFAHYCTPHLREGHHHPRESRNEKCWESLCLITRTQVLSPIMLTTAPAWVIPAPPLLTPHDSSSDWCPLALKLQGGYLITGSMNSHHKWPNPRTQHKSILRGWAEDAQANWPKRKGK